MADPPTLPFPAVGAADASTTAADLAAVVGAHVVGDSGVVIAGLTHDSARVLDGSLFCCVVGERFDGHNFAAAAVSAGASALLVERQLPLDATQIVVADSRIAMGPIADAFWGHPSGDVAVVGVTGTNGKTTTVTLVQHLLSELGVRCGVIGTLTGSRTTPEAPDLQAQLRSFGNAGASVVAMEVSSHALALHRVDGTRFAVAVFTNIGVDHLDFHETQERYFEAKARLFDSRFTDLGLVNIDDVHGRLLRDAATIRIDGFGLSDVSDLRLAPTGSSFRWRGHQVRLPLAGRFNVSNALAAAEAVVSLGHDAADVAEALGTVYAPPGRFEIIDRGQPFTVVVDYAHTPDALANLLSAAGELVEGGRLRVVFGCGGDRDRGKRPQMGAVACEVADDVTLTSDNPRSEDPAAIIAAVKSGCTKPVDIEIDRLTAIETVLAAAGDGDVVVIAGKGHETTQTTGSVVAAFDDREVADFWLRRQGWSTPA
ncbi:MAG: UDP-N-acetylmuramoyl-L-alanyl-D-glutamate--2,6-diaminopimelate ligase [Microthrixaceae bacterium]|nr:UDP-N-acetylmuramoyl-L-alanyl-D-glutamate--2,6-diaminopimelate ligase [Microthrixaceae bacterium]